MSEPREPYNLVPFPVPQRAEAWTQPVCICPPTYFTNLCPKHGDPPDSCDLALYRVSAAITFDVMARDERDAMNRRVSVAGVDQDKLAVGPAIHVVKVE